MDIIKKMISGSARSSLLKKNIIVSILNKGISVITSFLLVTATINYVNAEQYGIWLTLSSLIYWIAMFDFGMTHGFKNRFAEAAGNNNHILCKKYVSTSYVLLGIIFLTLLVVMVILNNYISWSSFLKLDSNLEPILKKSFLIIIICFCLKNIFKVTTTLFSADQRPAYAAIIGTVESILVLLLIVILTHTTTGNLIYLASVSSGVPLVLLIVVTLIVYSSKRYNQYSPSFRSVDFSLTRDILILGGKFFIIQLCMLFIFQTINIIISRNLGPEHVTIYNVTHKYYSVINSAFIIILTPFWTATTDAYVKGDLNWIKRSMKYLRLIFCGLIGAQVILCTISPWLMKIWLNNSVAIPWPVSILMAFNLITLTYSQLYMYIINGIGKISLQLIIYIISAALSIPMMSIGIKFIGLEAIIIVTTIVYLMLGIFGKIQIDRILNNNATGLWNK